METHKHDVTLSQKTMVRYLRNGGTHCPGCSSSDISGDVWEQEAGVILQEMDCHACGLNWTDHYGLDAIDPSAGRMDGYTRVGDEHDTLLKEAYDALAELMEWNQVVFGSADAPAWRKAQRLQRKLARRGYSR
jgi:Zn ribbon nucleic-acid-binding protein